MLTMLIPATLMVALPETPAAASVPAEALPSIQDEEPVNDWVGSVAAGLFWAFGNTERFNAQVLGDAKLRRENDRFTLGAWWYFAEETVVDAVTGAESQETTDERYGGKFQYDYFLSEKSYLLATVLAEHDKNANIDLRLTPGVGYGRQFIENETLQFKAELGVNYFYEKFIPEGDDSRMVARIATGVEWHVTEAFHVLNDLYLYPPFDFDKNFYWKSDTRLMYDLSASLYSQLQWLWDHNSEPAPGAEKDDHRLLLTVGWTF